MVLRPHDAFETFSKRQRKSGENKMEALMPRQAAPYEQHRTAVLIRRHSGVTRLTHWINALCLAIMLMSGLQIFNAHSALYWGNISTFDKPLFAIEGFPGWATIPSFQALAAGRLWHFFFAWIFVVNGLVYVLASIATRHFSRNLIPTRRELAHIGRSIAEHIRLHFPKGEEAKRYNVLQQIAYLAVIFGLLPLVILTGFCMSPQLNAAFPWLPELFGGRQSARTLHFIAAMSLFAFFIVHIVMVVLSGFWNNIRSMITGRYKIEV
jgi:thiosulfate reductase cytochrome b subunit